MLINPIGQQEEKLEFFDHICLYKEMTALYLREKPLFLKDERPTSNAQLPTSNIDVAALC
jgi:hypothetical protein